MKENDRFLNRQTRSRKPFITRSTFSPFKHSQGKT